MIDVLEKVEKICGEFEGVTENMPTTLVPGGPLMGNGDMGVVASYKEGVVRFYFTKNDFWYGTIGANGGGIKPFANLQITLPDAHEGCLFSAKQKIKYGEIDAELSYKGGNGKEQAISIHSYVLRQENTLVTEIVQKSGEPNVYVDLVPHSDMNAYYSHRVSGSDITVTKGYDGAIASWETHGYAVSRIFGKDSNLFRICEGERVRIVTCMLTNHDTPEYESEVKMMVSRDFERILGELRHEHNEWWESFWSSSAVELPSLPKIEEFWYASHYIIACCNKPGKTAPGIFGNFISSEFPEWAGDYHLNYNYEAPWWGAYSSNKIELTEPYDQPLLDCIPAMKKNARSFLNCSGLYSIVGIGPKGLEVTIRYYRDGTRSVGTGFWGQKSNAAYAAVNMAMRFYSTYDADYALKCAYPYMREVALFWEDYLRFEDGRYVIRNDCVNENIYAGIGVYDWATPDHHDTSNDFNPIISLGLIRLVMKTLIDICRFAEIEDDHIPKWEHILEHISDFPTQIRRGEKVFRLTESGEDWNETNSLIVQHIYPCGAIGLSSDPEVLELSRRTVRQAARWGFDDNAFPTFYTAAVRVGYDPDTVLDNMGKILEDYSYKNYFIFFGGGGIECSSAVPGCVNEMLFQSHEGILRFFPVWNKKLDAGFEDLRGYGAFLASAKIKDGVVGQITVKSEKGRDCTVLCPWECGMTVTCDDKILPCEVTVSNEQKLYTFSTEAGKTYICSSAE